ncbi:hypothetical protein HAX54_002404 [Datura stramonium]|uniref:Uncharacterized protein n=1 Tax=Datura stramonium TaxID=4076 RepID=A0ABS8T4Y5_DATST|nr:hypothetical protein [Datura stramonium]
MNGAGGGGCNERDDGNGGEPEDAESAYIDPDRVVESTGPSYKRVGNESPQWCYCRVVICVSVQNVTLLLKLAHCVSPLEAQVLRFNVLKIKFQFSSGSAMDLA